MKKGLADLSLFLELANQNSKKVIVFQHWERSEVESGVANVGNEEIQRICSDLDVQYIQLYNYFKSSLDEGVNPYRDNIHPNEIGQKLIYAAFSDNLIGLY